MLSSSCSLWPNTDISVQHLHWEKISLTPHSSFPSHRPFPTPREFIPLQPDVLGFAAMDLHAILNTRCSIISKKTNVVDHNSSGLAALLISQRLQLMCSGSTQVDSNLANSFCELMSLFVLCLHPRTANLRSAPSLTFAVDLSRLDGCAPTEPTCML